MHIVKDGETLFSISQRYEVTPEQLRKWNELSNNIIYIGQKLKVDSPENRQPRPAEKQQQPPENSVSDTLSALVNRLDEAAAVHQGPSYRFPSARSLQETERLFSFQKDSSTLIDEHLNVLNAEKDVLRGDLGLDFEASYLENFEAGFFDREGIFYKRRARVGIEWNILNNGLVENSYDLKHLRRQRQALVGFSENYIPADAYPKIRNRIQYVFNREKIRVLKSYSDLLAKQEAVLLTLYYQKYRTWDEVLALTSQKARIDQLLQSTEQTNEALGINDLSSFEYKNLPVVELNISMLQQAAESQQPIAGLSNISPVAEYHALSDISLSTSVNYNFFSDAPEESLTGIRGQREFISVGVNLSIPFPLQVKENNDLVEAKTRLKKAETEERLKGDREEIFNLYDNYQQSRSEYQRDYFSYKKLDEQVRQLMVKKKLNNAEYSPQKLLEVLADRYSKALELLGNHRDMYEKLLDIRKRTSQTALSTYAFPVQFSDPKDILSANYAWSVYVWSSTFEKYSNEQLLDFLNEQNFKTAFLSPGLNPDIKKMRSFIVKAHDNEIRVEWLVGNNYFLDNSRRQELADIIREAAQSGADGLHLDVEPQTFEDWDENREEYKSQYVQMVQFASARANDNGIRLSLSIPVYFDSIIEQIDRKTDSIQLMAYATVDAEKIESRTAGELKLTDKAAIVLRPQDFSDDEAFNLFINRLRDTLSVNRFSVHDLEALLKIKDRTINVN